MPTPINIISATAVRTVAVQGGDLFDLALTYLGDATQWERIADLNGLDDPILPANTVLNLLLPPTSSTTFG